MINWRNFLKKIMRDKESADKLYEKLRVDFTEFIKKYRSSGRHDMAQTYDDLLHAINLLDALTINAIEERSRTDKLINSLVKSQGEKDKIIEELQEEVNKRNSELDEFKRKYQKSLKWIDDYFKHSSETNPE